MGDTTQPPADPAQAARPQISRSNFDRLDARARASAAKTHEIIDGPTAPAPRPRITEAQFAAMPQAGRELWRRRGGRVGTEREDAPND